MGRVGDVMGIGDPRIRRLRKVRPGEENSVVSLVLHSIGLSRLLG